VLVPLAHGLALAPSESQTFTRAWMLAVASAYFLWFWTHGGQTLPMKTWRLRVSCADGGRLDLNRALLRLVLVYAGWGLAGAHFAWALVDRDGLFLHDRLVGTRIVRLD
jgi:uncharacterized RDD family membrane protein YckC